MIRPVYTWAVAFGHLCVWRDRVQVAEYRTAVFPALICDLVRALDHPDWPIRLWCEGKVVAEFDGSTAPRLIRDMAKALADPDVVPDDLRLPVQ